MQSLDLITYALLFLFLDLLFLLISLFSASSFSKPDMKCALAGAMNYCLLLFLPHLKKKKKQLKSFKGSSVAQLGFLRLV